MRRAALGLCLTAGLLLVTSGATRAQEAAPEPDAWLQSLMGDWTGTGQVAGMTVSENYHWEWAIGGQYAMGTNRGSMTMPSGEVQAFEVLFIVQPTGDGGVYHVWTFDSMGVTRSWDASLNAEGVLTSSRPTDDGGSVVTAVAGMATGTGTMTMTAIAPDGTENPMGSVTLTRQ